MLFPHAHTHTHVDLYDSSIKLNIPTCTYNSTCESTWESLYKPQCNTSVVHCGQWAKQACSAQITHPEPISQVCFWHYMCQKLLSKSLSSSSRVLLTRIKEEWNQVSNNTVCKNCLLIYQKWGRNWFFFFFFGQLIANLHHSLGLPPCYNSHGKNRNEISFKIPRPGAIKMHHLALDPCS